MPEGSAKLTLTVRFLARYAELLGTESATVTLSSPASVGDVLGVIRNTFPGARRLPDRPLCALNLTQVDLATPVAEGDELALLPPVAGG
jgi:molybdopterin converting factor small subunit